MANGISAEYAAARRANVQRYSQAMSIYDEIIKRTAPGGAFEKAGLAQIEAAKTKGVGQETHQMIGSGMYGTTTAAGIPARWESEVGAPARLRLEDILEQRRTTAQLGKAGFIERREDVYPDVGRVAEYERMAAAAPEPSLSDWMSKEFGTIGGGGVRRPVTRPTSVPTRKVAPTPTKITPPPGSPAALWAQGPEVWGASLEAERERAGQTGEWKPTTIEDYYTGKPKKTKRTPLW